ncbi:MAG: alanine racemase [Firmicutes bacterium]|nr:alanine racemase [Bacillota bacterium]
MTPKVPVWSEINLTAVASNIKQLISVTAPGAAFMAVVKANAYGHGAAKVARTALDAGAGYLGVARVAEGEYLRQWGINAPVLVLGYTPPGNYKALLENDLAQTIYSLENARELSAAAAVAGKMATVHVKVDTGMGRLGFQVDDRAVKEIIAIALLPRLQVEGIYTHFANADSGNKDHTMMQWRTFNIMLDNLVREGLDFRYRHAANSAAVIDLPETHLDMVRGGISIYGIYPSAEVHTERVALKPAMAVKASVAHVKNVPAGAGISYGITHVTTTGTKVATIPAGYADGYSRLLSNRGEVLLRGTRAPVIGRVCMDQFMVDVGHIDGLEPGEEAVLLGSQGEQAITADEVAEKTGTIAYEVLCSVSARVPRHYTR